MSNAESLRVLREHSVSCYEQDGRIYADTMISGTPVFEEVDDLTGYSMEQLKNWLGY